MTDPHDPERLRALEDRIEKAKGALTPKASRGEEHFSQANMAWRMVVELVAGLLIGFGMGWGLDKLLGTTPLFLVLFIGFGLAAGVKTMMRTAKEIEAGQVADAAKNDNAGDPARDERD
ncbi:MULTISPECIES: AtpZ/AtpI family protein [Roseobacteraceae]|jgi:ATP synthase protein I|uniref:ATP synthase protein I n=1 Tax=Celeribacter baekdonensis B30 TaxID=1208323 RepID=K2J809_9RHOB|nr:MULTISPECIES: AtpZ/AtpI family protein [Roseobacteraceae]EKE71328.1 ATP synthase F0 subunit I [Celeribacter baekdonensis B30]KAB6718104.1 F0F1 ATP synthase subunit I [Roseobacter sp. TSBP12]|tara:strand:- start:21668 stop:22024 length:357 start_codon:yes stop_codon:yes gene_type:complete